MSDMTIQQTIPFHQCGNISVEIAIDNSDVALRICNPYGTTIFPIAINNPYKDYGDLKGALSKASEERLRQLSHFPMFDESLGEKTVESVVKFLKST